MYCICPCKTRKLEPRAHKCFFIRYPVGIKGYKLWSLEPKNQRIIVTWNVIFYEKSVAKGLHNNGSKEPTSTIENVDIEWQENIPSAETSGSQS